jgi:hypothetical protein
MKNFKLGIVIIIITLIIIIGCSDPEPEQDPTYTVWTDLITYTEYYNAFGSLSDGHYIRYEFTSSEWNSISPSLTSEGRNNWTESQIKNWFIGRGFINSEANQETAWLMTINHGFIASRSGSLVYMILK